VIANGSPAELIADHAGDRVEEHEGDPERLAEVEGLARRAGLPTRRTGPTVSVLRAERIPPSLADTLAGGAKNGHRIVRRAANLEDVFVVLTGETVD
jgi:lipooligosaccharide transport system ATP-binding protein